MGKKYNLAKERSRIASTPLLDPEELREKVKSKVKPSVSITYLDYNGNYGIKNFHKTHYSQKGERDILKELGDFLYKARKFENINDLVINFTSPKGSKNKDRASINKMIQIQKEFNIETSDMIHLHCCSGGTGKMVFHGFILGNCFEIVWIDPDHQLHKCK